MIHEEDQPLVPFAQGVDEVKALGACELCVGVPGVCAELAGGEQAAEVTPALLALDETDRAAWTSAGVGELGADDGTSSLEELCGLDELDGAGAVGYVGEREGGEAEAVCALEQGGWCVDAGEEGVVSVDSERHIACPGVTGACSADPYGEGVGGGRGPGVVIFQPPCLPRNSDHCIFG